MKILVSFLAILYLSGCVTLTSVNVCKCDSPEVEESTLEEAQEFIK